MVLGPGARIWGPWHVIYMVLSLGFGDLGPGARNLRGFWPGHEDLGPAACDLRDFRLMV